MFRFREGRNGDPVHMNLVEIYIETLFPKKAKSSSLKTKGFLGFLVGWKKKDI